MPNHVIVLGCTNTLCSSWIFSILLQRHLRLQVNGSKLQKFEDGYPPKAERLRKSLLLLFFFVVVVVCVCGDAFAKRLQSVWDPHSFREESFDSRTKDTYHLIFFSVCNETDKLIQMQSEENWSIFSYFQFKFYIFWRKK